MKPILLNLTVFFTVMLCSLQARTQQKGIIRGMVTDNEGMALKSVTITLLKSSDSSLVKAGLSAESGHFEIETISSGNFLLVYTATGFETGFSIPFDLEAGQNYNALPVSLKPSPKQLQGVTVMSRKQLFQVKPDKTIFNVQNSINAAGSNALELLQKSPGIIVDNNENISMKGKNGVKVYLDGKMIQLGSEDLAAYLKSINSNDIESIEMIHNPGPRFDASGTAGIINIRLRMNNNLGTNGAITAGLVQGITPKANGSLNLNYRNKKINIFSNAGFSTGRYETDIIAPRTQKDTLYDQRLWQLSYSKSYNIKAGIDYFINKDQTLGIMNTSNYNFDDWASYGNTEIYYQPDNTYIKRLKATNVIPRKRTNISTNLNYRYVDTSGIEINFDADYGFYRGRARSYQPNYYIDKDNNSMFEVITRNYTPTDIDIYTSNLDFTVPKLKGKLNFGIRYSYVKTDNTLDFFTENNGTITEALDRSFNFVYKENVNAAYLSYQRQFNPKWGLQAGVRVEQTNSKGSLARGDGIIQPDNNVKKIYFDLFPNTVLTLSANEENTFTLSYSRRIDRPNYQGLNPFELKLDELSYVKGNSFLRPQYSDIIELSHGWKNKITTTVGYSHVKDFATQTIDSLNNYTYAIAKNLATQNITSFTVSTPIPIAQWWNGFINAWFNYQVFKGTINENSVHMENAAFGAYTQHTFMLGKEYTAELTGWFNGPNAIGPTLKAKSMGAVDIGFQKLLFQKKATIKFTVTDIFRTSVPFRAGTDFGGVLLNFRVTGESQTARISFSYRFGNNKVKAARHRQSGLETESKRIKES